MKELMSLNDNQLKKQLSKMHAYDIANLIKDSSSDIQMRFIKLMSLSKMVDVFIELPNDVSRNYFNLLLIVKNSVVIIEAIASSS